jgi:K+ transporter
MAAAVPVLQAPAAHAKGHEAAPLLAPHACTPQRHKDHPMSKLVAFAWRTTPLAMVLLTSFLFAAIILQLRGEGHWLALVLMAAVHVVFWVGTAQHRERLRQLQQKHQTELKAFAQFMLQTAPFKALNSAPHVSDHDVMRWRKFKL